MSSYVYIKSKPSVYTVGFYDPSGRFEPESDCFTPEKAAQRVAYLNGASKGANSERLPQDLPPDIFMVGQRVILNRCEVGTIVRPENPDVPNTEKDMWVHSPSRGYASCYSVANIKPLPNGQL